MDETQVSHVSDSAMACQDQDVGSEWLWQRRLCNRLAAAMDFL